MASFSNHPAVTISYITNTTALLLLMWVEWKCWWEIITHTNHCIVILSRFLFLFVIVTKFTFNLITFSTNNGYIKFKILVFKTLKFTTFLWLSLILVIVFGVWRWLRRRRRHSSFCIICFFLLSLNLKLN